MTVPNTARRRLAIIIAVSFAYVGSYAVMSASGSRIWSQSGKIRYGFGFAVTDVIRWDPSFAHWEPFHAADGSDTARGNALGYLYSPLICFDRSFIHHDMQLIDAKK